MNIILINFLNFIKDLQNLFRSTTCKARFRFFLIFANDGHHFCVAEQAIKLRNNFHGVAGNGPGCPDPSPGRQLYQDD